MFSVLSDDNTGEFLRIPGWRDLGEGDVKIFLAHLMAMGFVAKGNLEKYWDHRETAKTPFLGHTWEEIHSNQYCQIFKYLTKIQMF